MTPCLLIGVNRPYLSKRRTVARLNNGSWWLTLRMCVFSSRNKRPGLRSAGPDAGLGPRGHRQEPRLCVRAAAPGTCGWVCVRLRGLLTQLRSTAFSSGTKRQVDEADLAGRHTVACVFLMLALIRRRHATQDPFSLSLSGIVLYIFMNSVILIRLLCVCV